MSILAVIPARYESSRFPGKPLADIKGKPMLRWVYERAQSSSLFDKVIIATDDERIMQCAQQFGAEVMMTSDKHRNGTERIAEVVSRIGGAYDAVLNIQGDEPFVQQEQLELLCQTIQKENVQIASLAKKTEDKRELDSPNTVKLVMSKTGRALYFSRFPIPFCRTEDSEIDRYKHLGMYAFKIEVLKKLVQLPTSDLEQSESLEQLRWLEADYSVYMAITRHDSFGIDTPEDLQEALKRL